MYQVCCRRVGRYALSTRQSSIFIKTTIQFHLALERVWHLSDFFQ